MLSSPASALAALRRVERLGKGSESEKIATSLRLTLEAETLADAGIADRTLLVRALEADPKNARARQGLSRFEHGETEPPNSSRYYGAGAIGLVALGGILVVLLRGRGAEEREEKGASGAATDTGGPTFPATGKSEGKTQNAEAPATGQGETPTSHEGETGSG